MEKIIRVVLVGAGGYGNLYVNELLRMHGEGEIVFSGVVDPAVEKAAGYGRIIEAGVKIYPTLEDYYAADRADLCCISAPIQYHTGYTMTALENGSNVLCEKPLSGDWHDGVKITEAAEKKGLFVMSGYQWSHSDAILNLKRDILAGRFGRPVKLATSVLWCRRESYFRRGSGWAGKRYAKDGTPIFDSVANNAAAHYLHNMLYLMGDKLDSAAVPQTVDVQLARVNPIENFDTSVIRMHFAGGAQALFVGSHATEKNVNPRFRYEFEGGVVNYDQDGCGSRIVAVMNDGTTVDYGDPFECDVNKIRYAVKNAGVGADERFLPCTAKTAMAHSRVIWAIRDCPIYTVPEKLKKVIPFGEDRLNAVVGLDGVLEECYADFRLMSECGCEAEIKSTVPAEYGVRVDE